MKNSKLLGIIYFIATLGQVYATNLVDFSTHSLHHGLEAKAAEEIIAAKDALAAAAWGMWIPQAEFRAGASQSEIGFSFNDILNFKEKSHDSSSLMALIARQRIIDFSAKAELKMAQLERKIASIMYEVSKQKTLLQVSGTYFDVLTAKDSIKAAETYKELTHQAYKQTQKNEQLGLSLNSQVYQAQAQYLDANNKLLQANQAYEHLLGLLNQLSQTESKHLAPLKPGIWLDKASLPSKEDWIRSAFKCNLDIKMLELQLKILRAEIERATGKRLPTVSAYAMYASGTNFLGDDVNSLILMGFLDKGQIKYHGSAVGISVAVPLFAGGELSQASKEKQHVYQNALIKFKNFYQQLTLQVKDRYDNLILARDQLEQINLQVKVEYDILKNQKLELDTGKITPLSYLETQTQLYNVLMKQATLKHAYIKDLIALYYLAGELNLSTIHKINKWLER